MNSEGGYTFDPNFKMPTVSEPPEQPATPWPPTNFKELEPLAEQRRSLSELLDEYVRIRRLDNNRVTVGFDPAFKGGAPVYMVDGKIVAMDAEYHECTYQDYLRDLFDESHIVRGYD